MEEASERLQQASRRINELSEKVRQKAEESDAQRGASAALALVRALARRTPPGRWLDFTRELVQGLVNFADYELFGLRDQLEEAVKEFNKIETDFDHLKEQISRFLDERKRLGCSEI